MDSLVGPTSYSKYRVFGFYNSPVQFESDKISKPYLFVLFGGRICHCCVRREKIT